LMVKKVKQVRIREISNLNQTRAARKTAHDELTSLPNTEYRMVGMLWLCCEQAMEFLQEHFKQWKDQISRSTNNMIIYGGCTHIHISTCSTIMYVWRMHTFYSMIPWYVNLESSIQAHCVLFIFHLLLKVGYFSNMVYTFVVRVYSHSTACVFKNNYDLIY
jgi:hypothetical protein